MFGKGGGLVPIREADLALLAPTLSVAYQARFEEKIRCVATLAPFSFTRMPRRVVFSKTQRGRGHEEGQGLSASALFSSSPILGYFGGGGASIVKSRARGSLLTSE